jgi:cell division GTPase FtsZ
MVKIAIIGVGEAGRKVLRKLKDEGLEDVEMMSFGCFLTDDEEIRQDIPHHNLITMNGHVGLGACSDPKVYKYLAENAGEQIEEIIEKAFNKDE